MSPAHGTAFTEWGAPGPRDPEGGAWQGWWRRGLQEGHEALDLRIHRGTFRGSGQDQFGAFTLEGRLEADGSATLTKRYTLPLAAAPPRLAYRGQWNGRVLRGTWMDEAAAPDQGPFLLWPSPSRPAEA